MRSPGRLAVPVIAILAITTLAGCVSLPTSGRVNDIRPPGPNGAGQVVQLVPRPPGPGWTPQEVVTGFLAASGSLPSGGAPGQSALNSEALSVARDYLAPGYRRQWRPRLSSPTVIDSSLAGLAINPQPVRVPANGGLAVDVVYVTSNRVETLQRIGHIHAGNITVSARRRVFQFSLYEASPGQWRIAQLPDRNLLLLTESDFQRDYQPRDLYFFAGDKPADVLVPYPVFIPAQAQTQAGAQDLANDLLQSVPNGANGNGPAGWLNYATTTAFPPGATISSVEVSGVKATVNLDLPASVRVSGKQIHNMEAQLVWTLTDSPYGGGTSGIGSVQLVVRHGPNDLVLPQQFAWLPSAGSGPLYYQALSAMGRPVVKMIETANQPGSSVPVPTPAGLGTGMFTDMAVLPNQKGPAFLGACRGKVVYLTSLRSRALVIRQALPTPCTTLSWDREGNLWVTSRTTVYLLPAVKTTQSGTLSLVTPSRDKVLSSGLRLAPTDTVSSFQVAPDGVRAAMIVRSPAGSKVFVAAISTNAGYHYLAQTDNKVQVGADIVDPVALAWQSPDDLLVLGSLVSGGARYVFQVPLNGEPSARSGFSVPAGAQWLTADSLGVAVGRPGRSTGEIWQSPTWDGFWARPDIAGSTPVYSG